MMHTRRNFAILVVIVIALIAAALFAGQQVSRQTIIDSDSLIVADSYHLTGEAEGDLVVLASEIVLEPGSHVSGNAALIGGTISIHGAIGGDLSAIGEKLTLEAGGLVEGDASLMAEETSLAGSIGGDLLVHGDSLALAPDTTVGGSFTSCAPIVNNGAGISVTACADDGTIEPFASLIALRSPQITVPAAPHPLMTLVGAAIGSVLLVGTTAMAVVVFPLQISRIEEALRTRPQHLGGVGLATYVLAIGITVGVIIALALVPTLGLLLIPVYLIIGLALLGLMAAGLVTLALIVGEWILRRASRTPMPPLIAALVGSMALSAVISTIVLLPFGWMFDALAIGALNSVGLGAALSTRLGTRSLRRTYFVQG